MRRTGIAYGAVLAQRIAASETAALCGTEIAYGATRAHSAVLRWRMVLPGLNTVGLLTSAAQ
eukprot:1291643-Rhodomonas_salina.1